MNVIDGSTVRAIRYYHELTVEDFAKKLGVSESSIRMIENHHRRVTENMKFRIIKAFDLTDELLHVVKRYKQINGLD